MSYKSIQKIIDKNRGKNVDFGNIDSAPSDEWIIKAENYLGISFPPSYLWFLKNYGGGEIHGEEIFSIYEMPFDEVVGGDVVSQTMSERQSGAVCDTEVLICVTNYGEQFLIDSSRQDKNNEYPIVRKVGNKIEDYASSFADFIVKFIGDTDLE